MAPNLGPGRDDFNSKNNAVWYESFHKNVFGTIILYSLTSNTYYAIVRVVVRICCHVLYSEYYGMQRQVCGCTPLGRRVHLTMNNISNNIARE